MYVDYHIQTSVIKVTLNFNRHFNMNGYADSDTVYVNTFYTDDSPQKGIYIIKRDIKWLVDNKDKYNGDTVYLPKYDPWRYEEVYRTARLNLDYKKLEQLKSEVSPLIENHLNGMALHDYFIFPKYHKGVLYKDITAESVDGISRVWCAGTEYEVWSHYITPDQKTIVVDFKMSGLNNMNFISHGWLLSVRDFACDTTL